MITFFWIIALIVVGFISYRVGVTNGYDEGWLAARPLVKASSTPAPVAQVVAKKAVQSTKKAATKTTRKSKKGRKSR